MSRKAVGRSPKMIQNVFVLLLLSLFAILSTFLVTIGAQMYRNTVDSAEKNNNMRIMTAVVRSAIWAEDGGDVAVETLEYKDGETVKNITTLSVMMTAYDGTPFIKRLYAYGGYLLESTTLQEMEFNPEYGEQLCELNKFEPSIDGKVLNVDLATKDNEPSTVQMYLRAGGAAE